MGGDTGTNWINSNSIHQVLTFLILLVNAYAALAAWAGCTALPNGAHDCSASTLLPAWLIPWFAGVGTVAAIMKFTIGAVRDGFPGMFKPQPPVADQVKTVSVAVNAPKGSTVISPKVEIVRGPGKKN